MDSDSRGADDRSADVIEWIWIPCLQKHENVTAVMEDAMDDSLADFPNVGTPGAELTLENIRSALQSIRDMNEPGEVRT